MGTSEPAELQPLPGDGSPDWAAPSSRVVPIRPVTRMTRRLTRYVWPATLAVLLGVLAVVAMPAACDSIASVVGRTVISIGPEPATDQQPHAEPTSAWRDALPDTAATPSPVHEDPSGVARVVSAGSVRNRRIAPVLVVLTVLVLLALVIVGRPLGTAQHHFAVSDPLPRAGPGPRAPPHASCPSAHSRPRCAQRPIAKRGDARGSEETPWPIPLDPRAKTSLVFLPG